jgi:hypothetical protein
VVEQGVVEQPVEQPVEQVAVEQLEIEAGRQQAPGEREPTVRARRLPRGTEQVRPVVEVDGPAARFRRSLAVVIGIDTYGEGIPKLRSAVNDASAIADALERDHGFEVLRLLDDDARLPRLQTLLREELPARVGPEDRLLFYFAGHGIAHEGESGPAGYLVPAHAARADLRQFLPMQVLHDALAGLPVRHALVVLDCCFAGTFRWSGMRDVEPVADKIPRKIYRERYDRYLRSPAWQVLTSTAEDQRALDVLAGDRREGEEPHSPFARALLEALAGGGDLTQDNVITADELAIRVRQIVSAAADGASFPQDPQLFPLARHRGGQFVFQVPSRTVALEPAPPLDEAGNPYLGLQSFREADRGPFHGRDALRQRLLDAVAAQPLTVIVGPGSGKSTLVQAGLVPALRDRGWTVLRSHRPGRAPLAALGALTRELGAPATGDPAAAWRDAVTRRAGEAPCLVVIDHLEDLVTHRRAHRDAEVFLEALAFAVEHGRSFHVVVIAQSDAELQLRDRALRRCWREGRFVVPMMTRDELRKLIERPTAEAVLHFEPPELVDRLIDDVALVPAPLPLLAFALGELYRRCWVRWQAGDTTRALLESDYDDMGGIAGALIRRATALHDELVAEDPAYANTVRNVFTRMVALAGGELARRRVPAHELDYSDPAENRRVAEVLERFDRARLIARATELTAAGAPISYAEPAHDVLVRGWPLVRGWLDEIDAAVETHALHGALAAAVSVWRHHGKDDAYLWSNLHGPLIEQLENDRTLNADEARFVERSVELWHSRCS